MKIEAWEQGDAPCQVNAWVILRRAAVAPATQQRRTHRKGRAGRVSQYRCKSILMDCPTGSLLCLAFPSVNIRRLNQARTELSFILKLLGPRGPVVAALSAGGGITNWSVTVLVSDARSTLAEGGRLLKSARTVANWFIAAV